MNNNTKKTIAASVLSILILVLSQIGAELSASVLVLAKIPEYVCNIIAGVLYIVISCILLKVLCNKYLKSSSADYYITKFRISRKWIIIGLILPLLTVCIYFLLPGTLSISNYTLNKKLSIVTAGIFFSSIGAGVVEEMVFRGIIMNSLSKRYNKKIAVIVPSVLFGFVHILGMNFNLISCLMVIISGTAVGIMFSLIAEESKSVWNSAIVHILWNIVTVSGILYIGSSADEYSICNYVLKTKSLFITGGEFGIESSVISLSGYIAVSVITVIMIKRKIKMDNN